MYNVCICVYFLLIKLFNLNKNVVLGNNKAFNPNKISYTSHKVNLNTIYFC